MGVESAPGAGLAALLEGLDAVAADDGGLVDAIVAAQRQISHLRGLQARWSHELATRESYAFCAGCDDEVDDARGWVRHRDHPVRVVASELSAALCWAPFQADARTVVALELVRELPATLAALTAGV
ncbi:MAG: hypothetical protein ACRDVZ_08285, partial [Jiangellaceae bacterium]